MKLALDSPNPPTIHKLIQEANVIETDEVGHLVALIDAEDPDQDYLWFRIEGSKI